VTDEIEQQFLGLAASTVMTTMSAGPKGSSTTSAQPAARNIGSRMPRAPATTATPSTTSARIQSNRRRRRIMLDIVFLV